MGSMGGGYGSMGSMYGGGMGGYGGGYGSMYGGMGAYGGMGGYGRGGMYGQPGGMPGQNPDDSLTNNFQQSTQATFQIIESIVGAFGGFAQMLESTYMATHSSFFGEFAVLHTTIKRCHANSPFHKPWYQSPNNLATSDKPSAPSSESTPSSAGCAPSSPN